mmetsp:Transcript_145297/g.253582  ORF Transcript_145297/g.253582 Transcript_145297/m.253582 type:complete len:95 (+) Transcript_145297:79-363(+)
MEKSLIRILLVIMTLVVALLQGCDNNDPLPHFDKGLILCAGIMLVGGGACVGLIGMLELKGRLVAYGGMAVLVGLSLIHTGHHSVKGTGHDDEL